MSCKKIQQSIIAGYTQSPLKDRQSRKVLAHLVRCSHCREFAAFAQRAGIDPASVSRLQKAPGSLWDSLRARIMKEQLDNVTIRPVDAFFVWMEKLILLPQMLVVYIAAFSVFFIVVLNLQGPVLSKQTSRTTQAAFAGHTGYFTYVMGYTTVNTSLRDYFYNKL